LKGFERIEALYPDNPTAPENPLWRHELVPQAYVWLDAQTPFPDALDLNQ